MKLDSKHVILRQRKYFNPKTVCFPLHGWGLNLFCLVLKWEFKVKLSLRCESRVERRLLKQPESKNLRRLSGMLCGLSSFVCARACVCVVQSQAGQWNDTHTGSYIRENEALAIEISHIKTLLHCAVEGAVMLHPIALDYSFNSAAHGHLHVYAITVILYIPQLYDYKHRHFNFLSDSVPGMCFGPLFYNSQIGLILKCGALTGK